MFGQMGQLANGWTNCDLMGRNSPKSKIFATLLILTIRGLNERMLSAGLTLSCFYGKQVAISNLKPVSQAVLQDRY